MKVNFTKEHLNSLQGLALNMLFKNEVINSKLGQPMNIIDLLHLTTINTLNNLRIGLGKAIENLESQDEWVAGEETQAKLQVLKNQRELVNLIVGYKRYLYEQNKNEELKKELQKSLTALKESQKSPEDKIKELEAQIAALDN